MESIFTYLLLPLVSVVCSCFALELSFRIFGEFFDKQIQEDRPAFYYIPENSDSFQGVKHTRFRKKGAYRIAVVGDSFTFGPDMQFDDVFPSRLERMFNLNTTQRPVEVVNYGVPGYSTHHEVAKVREAIAGRADLVLLQITLNDPQMKPIRPEKITRDGGFGEVHVSSKGLLAYSKLASFVAQRIHNSQTHRRYVDYYHDLFSRKGCWELFQESLIKISRIAKKRNVKLAVVVFPLFGLPLDDSYPFLDIHQQIEKVLQAQSLPYLDLLSAFKGIPLERIQLIPGKDFHPNEIGHRIAAEQIYLWLANSRLVPESNVAQRTYLNRKGPRLDGKRFHIQTFDSHSTSDSESAKLLLSDKQQKDQKITQG